MQAAGAGVASLLRNASPVTCRASPPIRRTRPQRTVNSSSSAASVSTTTRARGTGSTATASVYEVLLDWADTAAAEPHERPVKVQEHPQYGRCLVAVEDIPNGTVLLSVPLEQVFQSQPEHDMHWAADMALRLLQSRHASKHSKLTSSDNNSSSSDHPAFWVPWVDSLPQQVVTPVEFTSAEVQQLVIPSTVQAVMGARESLEGCFEVLQPQLAEIDCSWQDFLWAVQVLHSRCFYEATAARHMAVPGVDMCNHSYEPNAAVRLVHSPAASQGLQALEEVAPVAAAAACPSYFQLVADTSVRNLQQGRTTASDALRMLTRPDKIPVGEQVCISYGPWPTEPLLLLFGFVPSNNPHDSLVLFSDLQHIASCWLEMVRSSSSSEAVSLVLSDPRFEEALQEQLAAAEAQQLEQQQQQQKTGGPPGFRDLTLYSSAAADPRLTTGLQLLQSAVAAAASQAGADGKFNRQLQDSVVPGVVRFRLQQLVQQLEQAAAEVEAASVDVDGDEEVVDADLGIAYQASAQHRSLIADYCSSKAHLARRLLG